MARKATGFKVEIVANPQTGEEVKRIVTVFDSCEEIRLWTMGASVEDTVTKIKADTAAALKSIKVLSGEDGKLYTMLSSATVVEEI